MHTHNTNYHNNNSSPTCNNLSPHNKLLRWWRLQSKWFIPALSTTQPAPAVLTTLPRSQWKSALQPPREVTSSSPKEDGSAPSARTITSRAERSATGARRSSPPKIQTVCQLTCSNLPSRRTPTERQCKRSPQLSSAPAPPRSPPRESATGPARGAPTTTLPSETFATNATWARSSPQNCSTLNNKPKMNNNKNTKLFSQCKANIAKPKLDSKPKSKHWMPVLLLGSRHSWQKVTPQKYL